MPRPPLYQHRQPGTETLSWLLGGALLCAGIAVANPVPAGSGIGWGVFAIILLCAVLFSSLTITVDEVELHYRFGPGPGVFGWSTPLAEIESVQAVRNSFWRHGLGIHYTFDGWVFNVSGRGAVEVCLRNGRRFRVGSDEPERAVDALRQALARQAQADRLRGDD